MRTRANGSVPPGAEKAVVYHDGERAVQARAGVRPMADRVVRSIRPEVPDAARVFLEERRLLVVAAADARGRIWASPVVGSPGFVTAPDPQTLRIGATLPQGDPLAGQLTPGSQVGTVAVDFATRRRARVNGQILEAGSSGLTLSVDQAYANCPKYIQRRVDGEAPDRPPVDPLTVRTGGLTDQHRAWIRSAETFFVGTRHPRSGADASHRGGNPGFIRVTGDRIEWPDYAGNTMFNTLGNMASNPRTGLLFLDLEMGRALQVTGWAEIDWDPDRIAAVPGAERLVRVTVECTVETSHRLPFRLDLVERSPFNPEVMGAPEP